MRAVFEGHLTGSNWQQASVILAGKNEGFLWLLPLSHYFPLDFSPWCCSSPPWLSGNSRILRVGGGMQKQAASPGQGPGGWVWGRS